MLLNWIDNLVQDCIVFEIILLSTYYIDSAHIQNQMKKLPTVFKEMMK